MWSFGFLLDEADGLAFDLDEVDDFGLGAGVDLGFGAADDALLFGCVLVFSSLAPTLLDSKFVASIVGGPVTIKSDSGIP